MIYSSPGPVMLGLATGSSIRSACIVAGLAIMNIRWLGKHTDGICIINHISNESLVGTILMFTCIDLSCSEESTYNFGRNFCWLLHVWHVWKGILSFGQVQRRMLKPAQTTHILYDKSIELFIHLHVITIILWCTVDL